MAKSETPTPDSVQEKVVAFAEQLGRIVGTVQAKTEGWFDRQALRDELTSVRDTAASLLEQLGGEGQAAAKKKRMAKKSTATKAVAQKSKGRSGGFVDAPGKRHRKPMPSAPGGRAADSRIAKVKVANELKRRG